ncbi:methionine--tRNA ligase subunit beta [Patescibacteria group bacterium]|nr:methionine--tRNA ligase subunit beta [Patescibacteria group bacterium]MBU2036029.1 methionine--tRNA ligase subunit beta [Patescibacteria group bacterium]
MDNISFEDFQKLDIRIAKVLEAEAVEGVDKLIKLTLEVGELGERTIVSGIRDWYTPEELVGKKIVYLSNIEEKEIKGVKSQGMLLAPEDENGNCVLLIPEKEIDSGTKVH